MDDNAALNQLEELARTLSVEVRYEPVKKEGLSRPGGLCRLKGEYILIINSNASLKGKIQTMATALKRFDLNQIYLRPGLRALLDEYPFGGDPIISEP